MSIQITVPVEHVDRVRSRIFSFISKREAQPDTQARALFITVMPMSGIFECDVEFSDSTEAAAEAAAFEKYVTNDLPTDLSSPGKAPARLY